MESEFFQYLQQRGRMPTFFEPLSGNNGDQLILMGARHVLQKLDIPLVDTPERADQILINGGGAMVDLWGGAGIVVVERYRQQFQNTPLIVAPSSYRFHGIDFGKVCRAGSAELICFAREAYSYQELESQDLPVSTTVRLSQDLAFELHDSCFIEELRASSRSQHVLIALRKDREGSAGVLAKTSGRWLPSTLRRPLSKLRDRLVARNSQDTVEQLLSEAGISQQVPRLYRDISVSVSFDEFIMAIQDAAVIITDRLHVGILGYLLRKSVFLRPGAYHKIRGVHALSMMQEDSRVQLVA